MTNKIAEMRGKLGWTQQDLADRLNTTSVSIGRYEKEDQRLTLPLLRQLAGILNCSVSDLIDDGLNSPGNRAVPVYDIRLSAGPGAYVEGDGLPTYHIPFNDDFLHRVSRNPDQCVILEVSGDSMWETLHDGDHALVDLSQRNPRLEGIFAIRIDDVLLVKRISMHPVTKLLTIQSDNDNYPTYSDINPDDIAVLGRVVWIGRCLG